MTYGGGYHTLHYNVFFDAFGVVGETVYALN